MMYDYNNNGNNKQAEETVPTRSHLWFFTPVAHCQSPFHNLVEKEGSNHSASSEGSFWECQGTGALTVGMA